MKYILSIIVLIVMTTSCNNPEQGTAAGNEADVRDSSNRNNPNSNVDDSTHTHAPGDTSHHH